MEQSENKKQKWRIEILKRTHFFSFFYRKLITNNKLARELFMENFKFYVEIEIRNGYFDLKYFLKKLIFFIIFIIKVYEYTVFTRK
jgi:hypothetical protein